MSMSRWSWALHRTFGGPARYWHRSYEPKVDVHGVACCTWQRWDQPHDHIALSQSTSIKSVTRRVKKSSCQEMQLQCLETDESHQVSSRHVLSSTDSTSCSQSVRLQLYKSCWKHFECRSYQNDLDSRQVVVVSDTSLRSLRCLSVVVVGKVAAFKVNCWSGRVIEFVQFAFFLKSILRHLDRRWYKVWCDRLGWL